MSAASAIPCPHCNQQVGNDPGLAGRQVSCPHCQQVFVMPSAATARPVPTAQAVVGGSPYPPAGPVFGGLKCPYCGFQGPPRIRKGSLSVSGWVLFAVLLFFCLPLCWLPFIIDACKEEVRVCGSCGSKIG